MKIEIYTDGSSSFNGQPNAVAGWAWALLVDGELIYEDSGRIEGGTSNQGELTAIIKGLQFLREHANDHTRKIILYSDSAYCINGISEWIHKWKNYGWYRNKGRTAAIKNLEYWQELDHLNSLLNIEWRWVKGHLKEDNYNNYVDKLAREQTRR